MVEDYDNILVPVDGSETAERAFVLLFCVWVVSLTELEPLLMTELC